MKNYADILDYSGKIWGATFFLAPFILWGGMAAPAIIHPDNASELILVASILSGILLLAGLILWMPVAALYAIGVRLISKNSWNTVSKKLVLAMIATIMLLSPMIWQDWETYLLSSMPVAALYGFVLAMMLWRTPTPDFE